MPDIVGMIERNYGNIFKMTEMPLESAFGGSKRNFDLPLKVKVMKNSRKLLKRLEPPAGVEPATY
jgi:hypothetical protein